MQKRNVKLGFRYLLDSTSNWKCLTERLDICHENLHSIEAAKRLCDIVREHQKQSKQDMTIRTLYYVLRDIGAIRAGGALIREAYEAYELRRRTSSDISGYSKPGLTHPEKIRSNTLPLTSQKHTADPRRHT